MSLSSLIFSSIFQVRAKNGADFLVAFEAGCIAHEAELKSGVGSQDDTIDGPMVIIVSNDLAMNVLVAELESRVRRTNRIESNPTKGAVGHVRFQDGADLICCMI